MKIVMHTLGILVLTLITVVAGYEWQQASRRAAAALRKAEREKIMPREVNIDPGKSKNNCMETPYLTVSMAGEIFRFPSKWVSMLVVPPDDPFVPGPRCDAPIHALAVWIPGQHYIKLPRHEQEAWVTELKMPQLIVIHDAAGLGKSLLRRMLEDRDRYPLNQPLGEPQASAYGPFQVVKVPHGYQDTADVFFSWGKPVLATECIRSIGGNPGLCRGDGYLLSGRVYYYYTTYLSDYPTERSRFEAHQRLLEFLEKSRQDSGA